MNAKLASTLSLVIALTPVTSAVSQVRRAAPSGARSGAMHSAPQFRGTAFRGAGFPGARYGAIPRYSAGPRYNWAAAPRFNSFTTMNRAAFNSPRSFVNRNTGTRTITNANGFSRVNRSGSAWTGSNRFGNTWNGGNRFTGTGFNRSGNWWRGGNGWRGNNWWWHHHHDSFVFFSTIGFPFFWDPYYPLYYSAYFPYYDYTPYSYDPYSYGYGYTPNYTIYGDNGYNGDSGYADPNYDNGQYYNNAPPNDQNGPDHGSIVARVQQHLSREGYYQGDVDGVAGSRTFYAIRSYQRDHHLRVTGEIDDELLQEMGLR